MMRAARDGYARVRGVAVGFGTGFGLCFAEFLCRTAWQGVKSWSSVDRERADGEEEKKRGKRKQRPETNIFGFFWSHLLDLLC